MTIVIFFAILVGVPLALAMVTVVTNDMDRRGQDGRKYGALTFLVLPVGLVVWLLARRRHPVVHSPESEH